MWHWWINEKYTLHKIDISTCIKRPNSREKLCSENKAGIPILVFDKITRCNKNTQIYGTHSQKNGRSSVQAWIFNNGYKRNLKKCAMHATFIMIYTIKKLFPSFFVQPPRSAQPVVRFYCTPCEPLVIENLPFDKYELEPSALTQYILERREPNKCWQVFISGSAKYSDTGHPFGYLKASSGLTCVNLFMMPYNYPVLLPLLGKL